MSVRENERIALVFCPEPRDTAFLIAHWLGICHLPCHPPFLLPPFRLSPQQISTLFFKLFHLTCPRNISCSPPLPRSFADTYSGHFQVFHKGSRASDIQSAPDAPASAFHCYATLETVSNPSRDEIDLLSR
ncbi:hypothetical protein Agabi119p4_11506 [Agaricus bisporus var. burnettii]|uniref:Uncharacterized protein n=1 Tax=Agaricus bisporus var. burnettii TaxID=192524 RepID=A0A8H7BZD7_AGABI|nr:hypothetical protein Agabi119p4_11506 [Agaricus bisporus var. burnettii]